MNIVIVQSNVNGRWGYCPEDARALLRPELDDEAPYLTSDDALAGAKRDRSMPAGTTFQVMPATVETCYSCKDGVTTLEVHEKGTVKLVEITCVVCHGKGLAHAGAKAEWEAFWCRCGNPSKDVRHEGPPDIYYCRDCGRVVQTG